MGWEHIYVYLYVIITLMSHEHYGVSDQQWFNCLFDSLFGLTYENIKGMHCWPSVRGIHQWPVDSPHKGPVMLCFHVMMASWCVIIIYICIYIDGVLPKGPYLPCLRMADRALLAGFPRYMIVCVYISWGEVEVSVCMFVRQKGICNMYICLYVYWFDRNRIQFYTLSYAAWYQQR